MKYVSYSHTATLGQKLPATVFLNFSGVCPKLWMKCLAPTRAEKTKSKATPRCNAQKVHTSTPQWCTVRMQVLVRPSAVYTFAAKSQMKLTGWSVFVNVLLLRTFLSTSSPARPNIIPKAIFRSLDETSGWISAPNCIPGTFLNAIPTSKLPVIQNTMSHRLILTYSTCSKKGNSHATIWSIAGMPRLLLFLHWGCGPYQFICWRHELWSIFRLLLHELHPLAYLAYISW